MSLGILLFLFTPYIMASLWISLEFYSILFDAVSAFSTPTRVLTLLSVFLSLTGLGREVIAV